MINPSILNVQQITLNHQSHKTNNQSTSNGFNINNKSVGHKENNQNNGLKHKNTPQKRKSSPTTHENSPSKRRRKNTCEETNSLSTNEIPPQNEYDKKQEEYLTKQKQHFDFIDSQSLEEEDEEDYVEDSQTSNSSLQHSQESSETIDYQQIINAASQKLSEVPQSKLMKHMYPRIEQEYREYCQVMSSIVPPVSFEEYASMELKQGNDKVQLFVLSDDDDDDNGGGDNDNDDGKENNNSDNDNNI
eukprot:gb/GECH01000687.1/.p1 GENE.gb/GECH01000687.1/~~gb/GECH01000687.1/.p1  ORF type:complete len:246 (+),score=94.81 gb/GECH01000687.1/:1-738(+)